MVRFCPSDKGTCKSLLGLQKQPPTKQLKQQQGNIYPGGASVKSPPAKARNLIVQLVKNPPAVEETWVPFLGQEDPLEEG